LADLTVEALRMASAEAPAPRGTIVAGTDGSGTAERAVQEAARLAAATGARRARECLLRLVVGDRGLTGIRRFLLGSVSERLSQHAPCNVLIVRGDAEPAR
jgi:nucleotide-binding universal stress UspA family protein